MATILVFVSAAISSRAQCVECATTEKKRGGNSSVRTVTRYETKIVVQKQTIIKPQKIAGIAITTVQPNAAIALKSLNSPKSYQQNKNTDADGVLNLENVPPGKYLLTVSLKGFVTEESEIEVKPQQLVTVPVNLAPITHDILIKTNVQSGEVRYAPIQKQTLGKIKNVGGYCMVPIENGSAAIARMQEGDYNLEIRPDDVEYKAISREITVSEDALSKNETADGKNEIGIKLERNVSTEDFLANWLPDEWNLPAGWKIQNKRMQVNAAGAALLKNERFNRYRNFELKSNLRLLDDKAFGFVLRATDDKNYYLIQMTGASAYEPYFLSAYVVKDGKIKETLVKTDIKSFASSFNNSKSFNLQITAKDNVFRVSLEDAETGRTYNIGIVEDQNNTFPIGAVGIGTKDAGRFEVNYFFINYK